jgi:nitrogen fixation/metabolism regulation signal transduction histidine kinase
MTVALTLASTITVVETVANSYVDSTDQTLKYTGLNTSLTLNGASTPAVSKQAQFQQALTSGAATVDLRALVGAAQSEVDGNGLKVRAVKLRGKSTNANPITISEGASNGYALFGSGFQLDLKPDQEILAYLKDGAVTIDGTHKTLDLAGTGSQILEIAIVLG